MTPASLPRAAQCTRALALVFALALVCTYIGTARAAALPDTGLFAPVARQLAERIDRFERIPAALVIPARVRGLLDTGQPLAARDLLASLKGHARDVAASQAEVWLALQDFERARPLVEGMAARADANPTERTIVYQWLRARDDAARVDELSRARIATRGADLVPDLIAAGRLAYDLLDYERAAAMFRRALEAASGTTNGSGAGADRASGEAPRSRSAEQAAAGRSAAHVGLGLVHYKRREWDASLDQLTRAVGEHVTAAALVDLSSTLVRLGRTDEAISACEWAVRLDPYDDRAHYYLGNGYARKNYTQVIAAYPRAFADRAGRARIARGDSLLAAGQRERARDVYQALVRTHSKWADARIRLASLDFEDGRFAAARDHAYAALAACPEYGRAHAVLAKSLESQRFEIDLHRADYEARFAARAMPDVTGIERFIANWDALSPRLQKRIAISVEPWRAYLPVLVEGGATYFIKPMYMLLSECPGLESLRDTRISYDSRLWDDVRGAGGYHTVTGIEDVERTIFDRYDTVLHELTHQVHRVMVADDGRVIQEHYKRAKERHEASGDGFLSRYAGGSVFEYFAEGANAYMSPRRDDYDPREIVRERLDRMDADLRDLVAGYLERADVQASYPIAYAAGGDDRVWRGQVDEALPFYRRALQLAPTEETALDALAGALTFGNRAAQAESVAAVAVAAHPHSGSVRVTHANAAWHAGRSPIAALRLLERARSAVRSEDRHQVDLAIGRFAWNTGDAKRALAAFDSVLAYQSDSPGGLRGRAAALALADRWDEAFAIYAQAVRERTGVVELRCEVARDLLRAGRVGEASVHLDEARLLDEQNPTAEALRGWAALEAGSLERAREHAARALEWGPWCDLAHIMSGAVAAAGGDRSAAARAWAPVVERVESAAPPAYVYRPGLSSWEEVHTLPAVEREILARFMRPTPTR